MARTIAEPTSMRAILAAVTARVRESSSVDVISPIGISVISFLAMIACIALPPSFYEAVVHEDDLMVFNGHLVLFYTACIVTFCLPGLFIRASRPSFRVMRSSIGEARPNLGLMIILPLSIALMVALVTAASILHSNPGLIGLILSGRGQQVKGHLDMRNNMAGMAPFALAILNYTQVRLYQVERAVPPLQVRLGRILWWLTFFAVIATALLKLARYEAIPVFLSWLIIFLRTRGSGYSATFSMGAGAAGLTIVLLLFSLFATLRGAEAFFSLMGYGPASFNHLAALLSGRLHLYGHGAYTFTFLDQLPFIHRFTDSSFTGIDLKSEFESQFTFTSAAGLNAGLVWVTSYGYYYADWGWWCLVVVFLIGVLAHLAWRGFNLQHAWGTVVYPWIASLTILAMTCANITRNALPIMLIMGLVLAGWDRLPLWKSPRPLDLGARKSAARRRAQATTR